MRKRHLLAVASLAVFAVFAAATGDDPPRRSSTPPSSESSPSASRPQPAPEEPPIRITAVRLHQEYDDNEVAADAKYKGHTLLVDGSINSIDKDFLNHIVVHLRAGNEFTTVMATVDDADATKAAGLKKRQKIVLLCKGGTRIMDSATLDECRIQ